MSSQSQPPFPSFPHVFHCLETLKAHLASLQQGLQLAQQQQKQQQQSYRQTTSYPPGSPPQYGLPPIPEQSPSPLQPHPHVYGHGYLQIRSSDTSPPTGSSPRGGGAGKRARPSDPNQDQEILAQIGAARQAIGPANAELNQAIKTLRREVETVYEWTPSNGAMGVPSLKVVEESYRGRDVGCPRRQLEKGKDCVVM